MMKECKYFQNPEYGFPYVPVLEGEEKINQCRYFLENANKIIVLTGAGMSTASGLPDYRSKDGLYTQTKTSIKPEELLSIDFFKRNRNAQKTYEFLNEKLELSNVKPNKGHLLLKQLEDMGKEVTIVTQNIDGLHQEAGSSNVIEMHGTLKTASCMKCGKVYDPVEVYKSKNFYCDCKSNSHKGLIKPDFVFYGEPVRDFDEALKLTKEAELLIVLGTSLTVAPFNLLTQYTRAGVPIIVINKTPTMLNHDRMSVCFESDIIEILEKIIE